MSILTLFSVAGGFLLCSWALVFLTRAADSIAVFAAYFMGVGYTVFVLAVLDKLVFT